MTKNIYYNMCRYGFKNYKLTYACFTCNIGFKRPNLADVQPDVADILQKKAKKEGVNMPANIHDAKCPNCHNEMYNLGRDLRLPVKTKKEQWQCIKYLYDNNYNIYSCGCSGIGFVPHKMKDAIELIENYKKQSANFAKQQKLQEKKFALDKKRKEKNDIMKTKIK
jgi:Zn finger protein HypA/HybF involved in hydrogenase expression